MFEETQKPLGTALQKLNTKRISLGVYVTNDPKHCRTTFALHANGTNKLRSQKQKIAKNCKAARNCGKLQTPTAIPCLEAVERQFGGSFGVVCQHF